MGDGDTTEDRNCKCTFEGEKMAVFTANAGPCAGNEWFPAARDAQEGAQVTACCNYLDSFAQDEYTQAGDRIGDSHVVWRFCQEYNTAYVNIEAKSSVCGDDARLTNALFATLQKLEEIPDNEVCCPPGRCANAVISEVKTVV